MHLKEERGITGIDIVISIMIITIFMAMIANTISNININSKDVERKSIAVSYAIQEIEQIKALGYIEQYEGKRNYWRRNNKRARHTKR